MKELIRLILYLVAFLAGFALAFIWFGWKMALVLFLLTQINSGDK